MGANDKDLEIILQVRIPKQFKQDLTVVAQKLNLSRSAITRFALQEYLYGVPVPGSAAVLADGPALVTGGDGEAGDG